MNLEQEFQKLMDEIVQKIQDKQTKGELSVREADDLIHIVAQRRHPQVVKSILDRDIDRDYDNDYEFGWQRSSWCGDNG